MLKNFIESLISLIKFTVIDNNKKEFVFERNQNFIEIFILI